MSQAYDTNGAIKITGAGGGGGADGINRISAGTQIAGTSTTVVFSNSNNVSFGMSNSSIVTASASFAQSTQPVAASAANGSVLFSTLSFSNANGVTFSTGAGPAIIGSVATTYRASNDAVGLNTAQSNVTWTVNSAGLSLDARGYAGTGTSATNASITLDSNGLAISVAAPGGGGAVNFSAGTTSNNLQSVVFSNSNGVSFGLNGSTITASHNALTSQSNQAWSGSNASSTFQTLSFNNANGVSWSNNAGAVEASYTRPVVSNAIQSVGSATNSGTNTSRFAADDHVHAGVFSMGVTNAGNSVGDTRVDVGRFVLQGGNSITLSQITAANALNTIIFSGPNALTSQSNQAWSGSNASSTFQTLVFNNANGASWSNNAGSVEVSYTRPVVSNAIQSVGSATGSGTNTSRFAADDHVHAGVFSVGVSNAGNTAGDTRVDVGRFVLAGGANITLSQATAAGALNTISIVGGAGGGGDTRMTAFATGNTTQSSTGTIPFSSYIFRGSGAASVGVSNGSVIVDVAAGAAAITQSIGMSTQTAGGGTGGTTGYATGDDILYHFVPGSNITMSQSINGASGTLSIYGKNDLTYSGWLPFKDIPKASLATNQGSLTIYPVDFPNVQFDRAAYLMSHSNATNSSGSHSLSFYVGVYSLNVSTLSLVASASQTTAVTCSGTVGSYSLFSAVRLFTLPFTTTLTEGRYWLGMVSSTNSAAANASYSLIAIQKNESAFGGRFGSASNATYQTFLGAGIYTAATNGIPGSVGITQINGTNSLAFRAPQIGFYSGTI